MSSIEDVASAAGVSKALVSRFLNNKSGVSEKNRVKIAESISLLNYRRNDIARSLVQQKTGALGIILDSICQVFYFDLIRGLEIGGRENNYKIIFCDCQSDPVVKLSYIDYLSHNRVDGLIMYGSFLTDNDIVAGISRSRFPYLMIENNVPGITANKVLIDNIDGAKRVVHYLFAKGYRDIRMVCWGMSTFAGRERCEGFKQGMAECGLALTEKSLYCNSHTQEKHDSYEIMNKIIDSGDLPEAIFFGADELAFSAINICRQRGVQIPGDLAIVGFDNDQYVGGDTLMPKLTTMAQPLFEVGKNAVQLLAEAISKPDMLPRTVIFPAKLIVGETA
jgi:DNA-binding LacI/PurR family transcriptional regulator